MERAKRLLLSRDDFLHTRGYWLVATLLREAGFEVILGGEQIPREVVDTAIQEDADIIGYHIMQGAPKVLIPILFEKMREKGIEDRPVVIGGIVPKKDEVLIKSLGVKEVFHPLTPMDDLVACIKEIVEGIP